MSEACYVGDLDMVKSLLDKGVSINAMTEVQSVIDLNLCIEVIST